MNPVSLAACLWPPGRRPGGQAETTVYWRGRSEIAQYPLTRSGIAVIVT